MTKNLHTAVQLGSELINTVFSEMNQPFNTWHCSMITAQNTQLLLCLSIHFKYGNRNSTDTPRCRTSVMSSRSPSKKPPGCHLPCTLMHVTKSVEKSACKHQYDSMIQYPTGCSELSGVHHGFTFFLYNRHTQSARRQASFFPSLDYQVINPKVLWGMCINPEE